MNTETKAGHDALRAGQYRTADNGMCSIDSAKAKLMADLKIVVADAQQLIAEAAAASNEGYAALRTRLESKLGDVRAQLGRAQAAAGAKTRQAADAAQAYVRENPLQSAGIAVMAGVVLGFCLGRSSARFDADVPLE